MNTHHVGIIGAGIGGLSAALALQRAGVRVRVFEQSPQLGEVGAGISLSPTAAHALNDLGLHGTLESKAYKPEDQCVRHWRDGRPLAWVNRGQALFDKYGERYYLIHRADLHDALASAVRANDPEAIVLDARCVAISQDEQGATLKLASGASYSFEVLVGADGSRSVVRHHLFGALEPQYTGYIAWRGLVPMADVPLDALDPPSQVWIGPGHMINRYPVSGGKSLNFVAFAERAGWEEEGWNIPASKAELRAEFADWHPHVTRIIEAAPQDKLFKWALCARSPLMRWVRGRAAVLGDAAHPLLPYLGQGAVMAIEDAVVLGRALAESEDLAQARARYEAARVGRARLVVERSSLQVPRFHADDPDAFHHDVPVDEALGLFKYDPAHAPV